MEKSIGDKKAEKKINEDNYTGEHTCKKVIIESDTNDSEIDTSYYEEEEVEFSPRMIKLLDEVDKLFG